MNKSLLTILVIIGFLLQGCSTYKRSFGPTPTDIDLGQRDKIYRLDLSNQDISAKLDQLVILQNLRMLNISGIAPADVERALDKIGNPEVLEVLILDSIGLQVLPNSIQRFKNLLHLSLNNNPNLDLGNTLELVEDLPIMFLNLQYNHLDQIPKHIAKLTTLKEINLSHNQITGPESFNSLAALPNLHSIWMTDNQLQALPQEIGKLSALRNLYLEHNQLSSLPASIASLKKVSVMHLGHNAFIQLPLEIMDMPGLMLLHVNNCLITDIPIDFANRKYSLKSIIMDNNDLSVVDKKFWRKEFRGFFVASFE